jgi:RimJ/RimL family protein N-acetyltransferase
VTGGLRFAEVGEGDLSDLLEISLSHPDFLALTEGSAGEHGHYDLEMLQRDWWLGTLEPGRRQLVGRLPDGAAAARLDLLDRNPRDGFPWIGLLMVHRDHGGQGLGRAAAAAAVELLGGPPVRLGVLDGNAAALAFLSRVGALEVEHRDDRGGLVVMELPAS